MSAPVFNQDNAGKDARGAPRPALEMSGITKEFPGVRALDDVSFSVGAGEIHGLVGENGAGKSTLMNILSGVWPHGAFRGRVRVFGEQCRFHTTRDAEARGVAIIHQELNLIPGMTVAENMFLGREVRRWGPILARREMARRTHEALLPLGVDLSGNEPVEDIGVGKAQLVEIARALSLNARVLILDEPTSALTGVEIRALHSALGDLRGRGVTCVYISHKLDEVFALCARITVLRDGRAVGTWPAAQLDESAVIEHMVGRRIDAVYPKREHRPGEALLEVEDFWVSHPLLPGERVVQGVGFQLRVGEVLGVAGLMGSGRTELLTALFGGFPGESGGHVRVAGQAVNIHSPRDAVRLGMGFLTEDRKTLSLVLDMSVRENLTLAALGDVTRAGFISGRADRALAGRLAQELSVRASGLESAVRTMSGGNQQKVVIGKWLATKPRIFLLDEPTRGVDVGAKREIYEIIARLCAGGAAVLMVSSELPEVLGLSDRVLVMRAGRLVATLRAGDTNQEEIMAYATGARAAQGRG